MVSPISRLLEEQARYAQYLKSKPTTPMGGGPENLVVSKAEVLIKVPRGPNKGGDKIIQ